MQVLYMILLRLAQLQIKMTERRNMIFLGKLAPRVGVEPTT